MSNNPVLALIQALLLFILFLGLFAVAWGGTFGFLMWAFP